MCVVRCLLLLCAPSVGGCEKQVSSTSLMTRALARWQDLWIIIDGKVYDVTDYIEEHPGGASILNNAGGDSTIGFKKDHHP